MEFPMIENYHPKKIVLGKVEEKGIKFYIPTDSEDFEPIRFQIPKMKIAFDIDERKTSTGRVFAKNISLSTYEIGSDNNKKRIEILRSKLEKTEKYIKKLLPKYLEDKKFSPSLWQGKNTDFKPTFKVSMNFNKDDKTKTGIFDSENNSIGDDKIEKGQIVSMGIKMDKLWIWNDKIGINWEIEQVKIYNSSSSEKNTKKKIMIRKDD